MNAACKNKKVKQNYSYARGRDSGIDTVVVMLTYALSRRNHEGEEIAGIVDDIMDIADSIEKGYCSIKDLEDTLWEEYRIRIRKRKEWLQGSLEE